MKKLLLPILFLISVTAGFAQVSATPKFGCPNTTHDVTVHVTNNTGYSVPAGLTYTVTITVKTPAAVTIGSFSQSYTNGFTNGATKDFVISSIAFTTPMTCDVNASIAVGPPVNMTYPYSTTYVVQNPPTLTITESPAGTLTVPVLPDAAYSIRYYKDAVYSTSVNQSANGVYTPPVSGSYTAKSYEPVSACSSSTASNAIVITVPVVEPTSPATSLTFSGVSTTSMTINWTNGNGAKRYVVLKAASNVDTDPSDGTELTANTAFGSGAQIGTGNYVVFAGSGSSVTVTGLTASTSYFVKVYEYNGSGTVDVLTSSVLSGNQATSAVTEVKEGSNINVSVYPNPMSSTVNISTALTGSLTYELADMNGSVVRSSEFISSTQVNVETLKAGTYVLTIKDKNQKLAFYKLVK